MCGIYGVVSKNIDTSGFFDCAEMANRYRGPDSVNRYINEGGNVNVNFGHTRLTITGDLQNGKQPAVNNTLAMVYNGEIFSFDNIHINGLSDTDFLAEFLSDGVTDNKLNTLNGFFAFAAYYHENETLYLVRDRFGEKPLYYRIIENSIYFSSAAMPFKVLRVGKISSIQETPGGGIDFNENQPAERIYQVPPGYILTFKNGKASLRKWYKPNAKSNYGITSYVKAVDEFERILFDAVKIRIKDQDTIAVSLSGGLDSTLVVDTIKKIGNVNIEAFTLSTNDCRYNELQVAKHHASMIGVNLNIVDEPSHDISQFNRCFDVLEFPSFNFSFVGYDSYYKAVREKGIRVILEGHGPDEYLGGYAPMHLGYIAGRIAKGDFLGLMEGIRHCKKIFNISDTRVIRAVLLAFLRSIRKGHLPSGQKINYDFFDALSMPIVLRTFDRISMLNHVETRSPFMDYRLVEFAKALPDDYLFHHGKTKSIIRTILESRGFKESDFGPKIGFTATYDSMLRDLCIQHGFTSVDVANARMSGHKSSFHIAHTISQKLFS